MWSLLSSCDFYVTVLPLWPLSAVFVRFNCFKSDSALNWRPLSTATFETMGRVRGFAVVGVGEKDSQKGLELDC